MINKIIAFSIFFFMLVAVALSLAGVTHVSMSVPFMSFLSSCNEQLNSFKIAIPDIPSIPIESVVPLEPDGPLILQWFIAFARGFFNFINFLIQVINVLTTIINTIIQLIQFIYIFVKNLIKFKDELIVSA